MSMNTNISVLCVKPRSVYKTLVEDCYDHNRDARNYRGGNPIIAHPPCRSWSRFLRRNAKPVAGERDLVPFCIEKIMLFGGLLEHPAYSTVWDKYMLPAPGTTRGNLKTIQIDQSWWGHPDRKRTWLLMPSHYVIPEYPFRLTMRGKLTKWSKTNGNDKTPIEFAKWLIKTVEINCD